MTASNSTSPSDKPSDRPKRWRRIAGLVSVLGLMLILALPVLAYLALESDPGKTRLARFLETELSEDDGLSISIGRIEGSLFDSFSLTRLGLSDAQGVWLEVKDLQASWAPWVLLTERRLLIYALEAAEIEVARAPELPPSASREVPIEIPRLPISIVTQSIALQRVALAEPLLGTAVALRLEGELLVPEEGDFTASLDLDRLDGTEGRLRAQAALDPEDRRLQLSLSLAEAAGGILAHLLGDPDLPALKLALDGAGTQEAWTGRVTGDIEGLAELDGDIELKAADGIALSAQGTADVAALLDDDLKPLVEPRVAYRVAAALNATQTRLDLPQIALETASLSLAGKAGLDLEALSVDGRLDAKSRNPAALNTLLAPLSLTTASAEAAFQVGPKSFTVQLQGSAGRPQVEGFLVDRAEIAATLSGEHTGASSPFFDIDARLALQGLASGIDEADGLIGSAPVLTFQGRYLPAAAALEIAQAEVSAATFSGKVAGALDLSGPGGDLTANLEVPALGPVATLAGLDIVGSGQLNLHLTGEAFAEGGKLAVDGTLKALQSDIPEADALLGDEVTFSAWLSRHDRRLEVSEVALSGRHAVLKGSVSLPDDFTRITADYDLSLPDLAVLSDEIGIALSGEAVAHGRLEGPLADPTVAGQAVLTKGGIEGVGLARLDLDYRLEALAGNPKGALVARGTSAYGDFEGKTDFALAPDHLTLTAFNVRARKTKLSAPGPLRYDLETGLMKGRIEGEAEDLAAWSDLTGSRLAGRLGFAADLQPGEARQDASLTASARKLGVAGLRLASADAAVEVRDLLGAPSGSVRIDAKEIDLEGQQIASLAATLDGSLERAAFDLDATGALHGPFDLSAAGRLENSAEALGVRLSKLSGTALGYPFSLKEPLVFRQGAGRTALEGLALSYGPGRLDGSVIMDQHQVQLTVRFDALPLALAEALDLGLQVDGRLRGRATLAGALTAPEGALDLEVDDFTLDDGSDTPLPKLSATAKVALAGGRLSLDGQVSGFADRALMVQAAIPARLSLAPVGFEASQDAPLSGALQFNGSAEALSQLFIGPEDRLKGEVYADLSLKGTLADPALSGGLGLRAATYENLMTGTTLKDLQLAATAEGSDLQIETLTARTSKGGKVTGSGRIDIDPDDDFPIDLKVSLSQAMLVQRDDVRAAFNGNLALEGTLAKLRLKGNLETTTAELRLIDDLPPEVVTIEVVEKNLPPSDQKLKQPTTASPVRVALNLKLSMPGRVFLRSPDIDTEWGGDFKITGTTDKPIIEGTLHPVRGHVALLGKRFLLQQGSISLDGSEELDPFLDLTAVHQKSDLTAIVQVKGRLSDPEITLTSKPPLPEDEVISRVLFDKSASTLTAAEALELASVVAKLAGGGSGTGSILGSVRGALGLDVLSVGASEAGTGASVSAGKYLADGVYVGVDQGTEAGSTKAKVEVDLTPNVKLESDVGADSTGSVGLKWQWDY